MQNEFVICEGGQGHINLQYEQSLPDSKEALNPWVLSPVHLWSVGTLPICGISAHSGIKVCRHVFPCFLLW